MKKLLISIVVLCISLISYGQRYYVKTTGSDLAQGTSWNTAFRSLQYAIDKARTYGITEIWVEQGIYKPEVNTSFRMESNISLLGGFFGNETYISQRNLGNYETILQGNGKSVIDNNFTEQNPLRNALLDGFTIKGGVNTGEFGGGINNVHSSITISECIIKECNAQLGGAIRGIFSELNILNTKILNNSALLHGGGISMRESSLYMNGCFIENNEQTIPNNGGGGGIGIVHQFQNIVIINTSITGNTSANYGGGILITTHDSRNGYEFENLIISDNKANQGGGIFLAWACGKIKNTSIRGNSSTDNGGGMYISNNSDVMSGFENILITGNSSRYGNGGCIYVEIGKFNIINSTLAGNYSGLNGGGIYFGPDCHHPVNLYNSIIWGNRSGNQNSLSNIKFTNNLYRNNIIYRNCLLDPEGGSSIIWNNSYGVNGGGNIGFDPLFSDFRFATSLNATGEGNFSLRCSSQAINAGNNTFSTLTSDLNGNNRIIDGIIDMGAYENYSDRAIIYVNCNNITSNGDGTSWRRAFKKLEQALAAAQRNPCGSQIWVAQGTYQPPLNSYYTMVDGVSIYGGFTGNETAREQRNYINNVTTLSAHPQNYVFFNFFTSENQLSRKAILDGFTLRDGAGRYHTTDEVYSGMVSGGAMFNEFASPSIVNCTFTNNFAEAGASMYNRNSNPLIINTKFIDNRGAIGIIYNVNSNPEFHRVEITDNECSAMFNYKSSPRLINVLISENFTMNAPCAGIYNTYNSYPQIINSTISGNLTSNNGISRPAGLYNTTNSTARVYNTIIWGNVTLVGSTRFIIVRNNVFSETGGNYIPYNCIIEGLNNSPTNINSDPLFINYSYSGSNASPGNFNLNIGSPAINTGNNSYFINNINSLHNIINNDVGSEYPLEWNIYNYNLISGDPYFTDLNGTFRMNGNIDMGAYEKMIRQSTPYGLNNKHAEEFNNIFQDINIYPNPASDLLYIRCDIPMGNCAITIIDVTGRKVLKTEISGEITTINVSLLTKGVYFIIMDNNDDIIKFIKE